MTCQIPHINRFSAITLADMDRVALMNRTDTKFILTKEQLENVFQAIREEYHCLEVEGVRDSQYQSLYLDTIDNQFYNDHHRGKINRIKIRVRKYVESNLHFLEIKQKGKRGRTAKSRIRISDFESWQDRASLGFLEETLKRQFKLQASLWNQFRRITLVNKTERERVTVDMDLSFDDDIRSVAINKLAIVEVKQHGFNRKHIDCQSFAQ